MYHYLTLQVIMRDCKSADDAREKCADLMPQYPDKNTKYMESWFISRVISSDPTEDESQVLWP